MRRARDGGRPAVAPGPPRPQHGRRRAPPAQHHHRGAPGARR